MLLPIQARRGALARLALSRQPRRLAWQPSPYDCRPTSAAAGGGQALRVGGHSHPLAKQGARGQEADPGGYHRPVWARREAHSIYRLGVAQRATEDLGGIGFVDLQQEGSVLTEGREFGMLEGKLGMITLTTALPGEIIAVNSSAMEDPATFFADGAEHADAWLVEVDALLDDGDAEDEWDALKEYNPDTVYH